MGILNLGGGGGNFLRFQPSVNAWIHKDQEVQLKQIVLDHTSMKTGWGKMSEGAAPEWQWDAQLGVGGRIPSDDKDKEGRLVWKRGFAVTLFTRTTGVAEWSSTGTGPCIGFEKIVEEIWNEKDQHPGEVPVVEYTGSEARKIGKGNTRAPNFTLVKWIKRDTIDWTGGGEAEAPAPDPEPAPVQKTKAPAPADDDVF